MRCDARGTRGSQFGNSSLPEGPESLEIADAISLRRGEQINANNQRAKLESATGHSRADPTLGSKNGQVGFHKILARLTNNEPSWKVRACPLQMKSRCSGSFVSGRDLAYGVRNEA